MNLVETPWIAPEGFTQFRSNVLLGGEAVIVWVSTSPRGYHCSACTQAIHDVLRESLPDAWSCGPQGFAPATCVNPACQYGGRYIE